ncbi:MAG TPA: tRNA adenosine(34) deaminase TadA [Gammaproteobacteria bacterium]|nr:tRNA adenosine(34) deaminase TadA [Gammaproteobacteria bacterium]
MRRALRLARRAGEAGEVPIGALVIRDGRLLGAAANAPIGTCDPTAHAEILALRRAARRAGNYRLPGATLYVTLEPCAMCTGAIVHARIARVVYGADDPRAGAVRSVFRLLDDARLNHRAECTGGIEAAASAALLQAFFRRRRGE